MIWVLVRRYSVTHVSSIAQLNRSHPYSSRWATVAFYLEQDTPPSSTCKIPEKHVLGGYLLQRLTDHRHPKPCRYKRERASGAVRFLDDPRLETHPAAYFQEPIAVVTMPFISGDLHSQP